MGTVKTMRKRKTILSDNLFTNELVQTLAKAQSVHGSGEACLCPTGWSYIVHSIYDQLMSNQQHPFMASMYELEVILTEYDFVVVHVKNQCVLRFFHLTNA